MINKKAVFKLSPDMLGNPGSIMGDEKGIYFSFMSDMGKIAEVLPAPLEPAFPIVSGSILYIDKPTFAESYREAMLGVYAKYNGEIGMYPIALVLSGPGALMGTLPGRERYGLPKKICEDIECIRLERDGDRVRGIVERKGVRLLDISLKIGEYDSPMAAAVYNGYCAGATTGGNSYYTAPVTHADENGSSIYTGIKLYKCYLEYNHHVWDPGSVVVRMQSSPDDPWGHFPVFAHLGGAWAENDLEMQKLWFQEMLPADERLLKLLTSRYDRKTLGLEG